jgi:hypothetical protein
MSTTVFEITTTTLSIADEALTVAYDSCKNWREHELVLGDILFASYPYTNEKETNFRTFLVVNRSLALMKQAADLDKSYSIYVTSLQKWVPEFWAEYQESLGAKPRPFDPNRPAGTMFSNLCADFGLWPSHPGRFPPIDREPDRPEPTALNGARRVCYQVFYQSPDEVVYYGDEAFTLQNCDAMANQIAGRTLDYQDAFDQMIDAVFQWRDSWCWGRNCIGRYDVNG